MARSKTNGANVSQAVRDYAKAHRNSKPKQIAAALKTSGIDVAPSYVSNILSNDRKKKGKRKRVKATAPATNGSAGHNVRAVAMLLKSAQEFVGKAGGLKQARQALDAINLLA